MTPILLLAFFTSFIFMIWLCLWPGFVAVYNDCYCWSWNFVLAVALWEGVVVIWQSTWNKPISTGCKSFFLLIAHIVFYGPFFQVYLSCFFLLQHAQLSVYFSFVNDICGILGYQINLFKEKCENCFIVYVIGSRKLNSSGCQCWCRKWHDDVGNGMSSVTLS